MKISNTADCSAGTYEAYSTAKNGWSHGVSNGTATVSVLYRDAAGNESSCVSDTIIHDNILLDLHSSSNMQVVFLIRILIVMGR